MAEPGSLSIPLFWRRVEEQHPFEQAIAVGRARVLLRHGDLVVLVLDADEWLVEAGKQALDAQLPGPSADGVFGRADAASAERARRTR